MTLILWLAPPGCGEPILKQNSFNALADKSSLEHVKSLTLELATFHVSKASTNQNY